MLPLCLTTALVPLLAGPAAAQDGAPPARQLLLDYSAFTRLAGTSGSLRAAEFLSGVLEEAGWQVTLDERVVLLSLPRLTELEVFADGSGGAPLVRRIENFDPDARPAEDLPPFNAWSASGEVRAQVVDCGYGMRADFEALRQARVELAGTIALCRYGQGYRGFKPALAAEYGCVGALLFSDPADDGAERGPVWPAGPWKPGWAVQRGSIAPMGDAPGDLSTPGFPSPAPGEAPAQPRRSGAALDAALPGIPCLPIGADDAAVLRAELRARRMLQADGSRKSEKVGPGPVEVRLRVEAPRELRTISNVLARLPGKRAGAFAAAGNHRDAWVRGAHDAGGGTVALLRAAQRLGDRARAGWRPEHGILLAFWDAEETGIVGSTEFVEANAALLERELIAYVNADTAVSGARFGVSGTPGLEALVQRAAARVPSATVDGTLADEWFADAGDGRIPELRLPGSGSDHAAFLHHLGLPVLDVAFGGASGGQYHTSFDDFAMVERFLDPGFVGHELAGAFCAELLAQLADLGHLAFDDAYAAREMARHAERAAEWLGAERAARLAAAYASLSGAIERAWAERRADAGLAGAPGPAPLGAWPSFLAALDARPAARDALLDAPRAPAFYRGLRRADGLPGRAWFRNALWAPDPATGYASLTFPTLRAAEGDEAALDLALGELVDTADRLRATWEAR
jgi:N-acetylated-alpha-linked acidic dipeptidase